MHFDSKTAAIELPRALQAMLARDAGEPAPAIARRGFLKLGAASGFALGAFPLGALAQSVTERGIHLKDGGFIEAGTVVCTIGTTARPLLAGLGLPMVNNRRAYFSWQLGEEGLHSWHFLEETACRPIPTTWLKELSLSGT